MIDLMGNVVWTEAQINRRVVEMIRQKYSENEELKLARIAIGDQRGTYTPTPVEEAEIVAYQEHVLACRELGRQAQEDNDILREAIAYEQAVQRLAKPVPDVPEMVPSADADGNQTLIKNPVLVIDAKERAAAQATIDNATQTVLDLVAARKDARATDVPDPDAAIA